MSQDGIVFDLIIGNGLFRGGRLALGTGTLLSDHLSLNSNGFLLIHNNSSLLSCLARATAVQSFVPVLSASTHKYPQTDS